MEEGAWEDALWDVYWRGSEGMRRPTAAFDWEGASEAIERRALRCAAAAEEVELIDRWVKRVGEGGDVSAVVSAAQHGREAAIEYLLDRGREY